MEDTLMRDASNSNAGYCMTCIRCGKIHQKGYAADATFICPRCGQENYVYLRNGVQIVMPAGYMQSRHFLDRVRNFAISLDRLSDSAKESETLQNLL